MKDITISAKRIRTELRWLLYSLIFAFILNIYSIARFDTRWSEIVTSLPAVILLSLVFYVLLIFIRGLAALIMRFAAGRQRDEE